MPSREAKRTKRTHLDNDDEVYTDKNGTSNSDEGNGNSADNETSGEKTDISVARRLSMEGILKPADEETSTCKQEV